MHRLSKTLLTLSFGLAVLGLLLTPLAGHSAPAQDTVPSTWIKGVNMINYGADPYPAANMPAAIGSWRATGANAIALAPRWFMNNGLENTMAPDPSFGTPSDESLINAIKESHRQGLRVNVRPYIDLRDGSWRAELTPTNPGAWFSNYTAFLNHYLDIAQQQGVEEFTLGVELINMTDPKYAANWQQLIAQSRTRFSGKLTYSANWGKPPRIEYNQITWWDKLDYIGISAYFPLSESDSPSLDTLVGGWTKYSDHWGGTYNWVADLQAVHERYNKDVVFTEIGFGSYINSPARWDQPGKESLTDQGVQDRAVEATMRVWSTIPWFKGIYWWHWEPYVGGGGANDHTDALNNKPAVQTLTRWFGGNGQPPPVGPTQVPQVQPTQVPQVQPTQAPPTGDIKPPVTLFTDARPAAAPGTVSAGNPAFDRQPSPGADTAARIYFDATGHSLSNAFYTYWKANGGLWLFGYPISEAYPEVNATDGQVYIVQYFERQRFEYHPEKPAQYRVLLGLLGTYMVAGRNTGPFAAVTGATGSRTFFAESGHTLGGQFQRYWTQYGGLPIFGYPLSEEFAEKNDQDGKTYIVQYFERGRFELHPEYAGTPNEVLLGLLGHWYTGK